MTANSVVCVETVDHDKVEYRFVHGIRFHSVFGIELLL
jgi:hypothetical protein